MELEHLAAVAKQKASRGGASVTGMAVKRALQWPGIPIASGLVVLMDLWKYGISKNYITTTYEKEIGARLNKPPELVTGRDLNKVAKENPTLGDALIRAKRKRNLDIVTDVIAITGAFALATGGIVTGTLAVAAVSFGAYIAGKYLMEKVGSAISGLNEPSVKKVFKHPELQEKLSLPSQVLYLQRLQNTRKEISAQQVTTLFNKANTGIAPVDAAETANKLNDGLIDATELAFTVYGQKSGIPERESRELTRKEKIIEGLQDKLAVAQDALKDAGSVVKDKATDVAGSWKHCIGGGNRQSPISPEAVQQGRQEQTQGVTF